MKFAYTNALLIHDIIFFCRIKGYFPQYICPNRKPVPQVLDTTKSSGIKMDGKVVP